MIAVPLRRNYGLAYVLLSVIFRYHKVFLAKNTILLFSSEYHILKRLYHARSDCCEKYVFDGKPVRAKVPNFSKSIGFFSFMMRAKAKPKRLLRFVSSNSCRYNYSFLTLFINLADRYNAIASSVEREPERTIRNINVVLILVKCPHVWPPKENLWFSDISRGIEMEHWSEMR